ncbi:MAG: aldo/keto reductase [Pseudoclavibacter sp.]
MNASTSIRRPLSPGGPLVPPLGLGSWNTWDRMSPEEAVTMITTAVEGNAGLFDVGSYSSGPHVDEQSSTDVLFGNALRSSGVDRDDVTIFGKLWLWEWPGHTFREQAEHILERSGLEKFDALVVGAYPATPDVARLTEEIGGLVADGLANAWGISNWIPADVHTALDVAKQSDLAAPVFAQLKYSIARRSMGEGEKYSALFRDGTLTMQASDMFEGGILAGKLQPTRRIGLDDGGIRSQIIDAYPAIERVAAEFGATPAQAAIAFCLAYEPTSNVLFGASRLDQLRSNLAALELVEKHGTELRTALDEFWLDRGGVPAGWIAEPADALVAW